MFVSARALNAVPDLDVRLDLVATLQLSNRQLRVRVNVQMRPAGHPLQCREHAKRFGAVVRARRQMPKQQPRRSLSTSGKDDRSPTAATAWIAETCPIGVGDVITRVRRRLQQRAKLAHPGAEFGEVERAVSRLHVSPRARRALSSRIFSWT